MESSERTKYKFADAVKELMRKDALDKISVKDIVENCGMTRQTFYRHFQDKYALVNWYFEVLVRDSFKEMGTKKTLEGALIKKFYFIKSEKYFFKAAFQSKDYNSLMEYDYQYILNFYTEVIEKKTGKPLEEDVRFLLEMYCRGSISMTANWAIHETEETPEEMARLLVEALPMKLQELLIEFV
ncbi:TetR/AcrR family transcriptional regulator C-terminal domain-containing protein [Hespellia stercorisuis]|uniref:Transcriptional regulator, TetR family n=1 Tax=Hespellia stercorisuis DSM 15480 TaxID=1121950 RepID=A0A1M6MDU6_9FIRM|nr:TetR/AcrR family transcriptional regulator C-terminal domain-containing protein [Hespellia stercorisuis]SHJ81493.1 transcriptional regulator, TetR family [Hespellia stercorisuis DSM 15480]